MGIELLDFPCFFEEPRQRREQPNEESHRAGLFSYFCPLSPWERVRGRFLDRRPTSIPPVIRPSATFSQREKGQMEKKHNRPTDCVRRTKVVHQGNRTCCHGGKPWLVVAHVTACPVAKRTTALGRHGWANSTTADHRSKLVSVGRRVSKSSFRVSWVLNPLLELFYRNAAIDANVNRDFNPACRLFAS